VISWDRSQSCKDAMHISEMSIKDLEYYIHLTEKAVAGSDFEGSSACINCYLAACMLQRILSGNTCQ
jgi:hypothetical protein